MSMKAGIGSVVLAFGLLSGVAHAEDKVVLNVTTYGGTFQDGWQKAVIAPFEKKYPNIQVKISEGLTFQNVALMRAQKDDVKVDVIMTDQIAASQAAAEGLTEAVSEAKVPNLKSVDPAFRAPGDQYVIFDYVPEVLAYNTNAVKEPPHSWLDIFDPKYRNKIAINNLDTTTGILFFMTINQIKGGSLENVDPAFNLIKANRDYIVNFPTQHAQLAQMLSQGDVVMAPWVSDRSIQMVRSGAPVKFVIPSDGHFVTESTLAIAKGTKKLDAALKYVNFVLSTEAQEANAAITGLSPVNKDVVLPPDVAKIVPHDLSAIHRSDWTAVNRVRGKWLERWNREILR